MARGSSGLAGKLAFCAGVVVLAAAVPSAVYAVGEIAVGSTPNVAGAFASFTPASVDPRLAEILAQRSSGTVRMMRFTPAGARESGESRSVTVAVRLGSQSVEAINGVGMADSARGSTLAEGSLRLAPTRYNLGVARGYSSFAQAPALSTSLSSAQIPDLAEFRPTPGVRDDPSRFAARVEVEQGSAAPRTAQDSARVSDRMLDVGGSYRLTRNLDVTAGVRYQQERELRPLPDLEQQDSQAVYVGTQFRF